MKVLVVDDASEVIEAVTISFSLQWQETEVIGAAHGEAALDLIEQEHPDVVLLDIAMPGMNGYDVARSVRGRPHLAGVVLVALTGYGQEDDRRRAFEAGFDYHLCKPASLETLENLLAAVPAGRPPDLAS